MKTDGIGSKLVLIGNGTIKLKNPLLAFQRGESEMRQSLLEWKISKDLMEIREKVY